MRNLRIVLFSAILLAACISLLSPAFGADRYRPGDRDSGRDTRTGVVLNVDPHVSKLVVAFSDNDRSQVFASQAGIFSGGRGIRFGDIRVGDRIRIDGAVRSMYVMDAYRIDVVGHTDIRDYDRDRGRDRDRDRDWDSGIGRTVTLRGQVTSIDTRRGKIVISDRGSRTEVLTSRNTNIREDGRSRSVRDIRDGDYVTVTGRTETRSTVNAYSIDLEGRRGSPYGNRYDRSISGQVVKDSGKWDRDITVRTSSGDRKVEIPKGITIMRGRDGISVHDINKGDYIRADGRSDGSTFVASRVEVSSGRGGYYDRDDRRYRPGSDD